MTKASATAGQAWVDAAFPEFRGRFEVFGFDWLGRQFATDRARGEALDPEVMIVEAGTGEALEVPVPFSKFHDEELVDYSEEALAVSFYLQWQSQTPSPLEFGQCVGYQVPLFLGGKDQVENLELMDIEIYWDIMGRLRAQAREAGLGNAIAGIDLS
ncbi:T6SS immunity protein Tdi1 domain-containing protein [Kribbella sp. NPDC051587]|uniref:T6SS immunity protein Tdi1 domain-containing protein n=1 Tax=Kribbella sp. NPDC051587 TaxID=3364119 RepID=UPI0037BA112C